MLAAPMVVRSHRLAVCLVVFPVICAGGDPSQQMPCFVSSGLGMRDRIAESLGRCLI